MDAALASSIAGVISFILSIVKLLVIASVVVSWIGDSNNQIVQMVYQVTEPIYRPIRQFTRRIPGPFDWAPIAVFVIIIAIERGVVGYLNSYARSRGMY
ncbi:MAG: YggT family protein [Oligoflexales bacterium]